MILILLFNDVALKFFYFNREITGVAGLYAGTKLGGDVSFLENYSEATVIRVVGLLPVVARRKVSGSSDICRFYLSGK